MELRFQTELVKIGINFCIIVPDRIVTALLKQAGKAAGPVPIKGLLNRTSIQGNVVKYAGAHRLYLNSEARMAANVTEGSKVTIEFLYDPVPRMPPIPDSFRLALRENEAAKTAWRLLPSAKRRLVLERLNALKNKAANNKAIKNVIQSLLERRARSVQKRQERH